jgi:hypothetical protein
VAANGKAPKLVPEERQQQPVQTGIDAVSFSLKEALLAAAT